MTKEREAEIRLEHNLYSCDQAHCPVAQLLAAYDEQQQTVAKLQVWIAALETDLCEARNACNTVLTMNGNDFLGAAACRAVLARATVNTGERK